MPSVYVTYSGHCADSTIRHRVIDGLAEVARLSDVLRPDQARYRTYDDEHCADLIAERGLFPDTAGVVIDERYILLCDVCLNGIAFQVPHNLAIAPGEDMFGFVFARVGNCPDAVIVGVAEPDDRERRARPRFVMPIGAMPDPHAGVPGGQRVIEWPRIKMRTFGIDWIANALAVIKRHDISGLDYAAWDELQGSDQSGVVAAPTDARVRQRAWHVVKADLLADVISRWNLEPEIDAILAANVFEPAWAVNRLAPRRVVLSMTARVRTAIGPDTDTQQTLAGAARQAIVAAGVGVELLSLGFGFRGHELILSSTVRRIITATRSTPELRVWIDICPPGLSRRAIKAPLRIARTKL